MHEKDKKMAQNAKNQHNSGRKRTKFDTKKKFGVKKKPRQVEDEEIKRITNLYPEIKSSTVEKFADFPLSQKTQTALDTSGFLTPTDIQREAIGLALQGNDILGAAKTGSGKTLAFLIPVLECLYCRKWSSLDGLGALIITPTRELAYQIFEVLRKIGKNHDFSAGLVIGGKLLREEALQIPRTNVVICTPGRLLQHMDETVLFKADALQILVLDEADRILDLGFAVAMNAIIANLPSQRQTMLFSATQTRSVKDLARLSLKEPMYVSVNELSAHATPDSLQQSYLVCELHDKVSMLWSFIKNHLKNKILVFVQSCKQVRFLSEVLKLLHPGVPILALHGSMQQLKRVASYQTFCRKQHAVLLATDVAARGLDFPAVHWVLQLDCPEDASTYIHRAGRTARYEKNGEALLVLLPSEQESMCKQLEEKKIPINAIKVNPIKLWSIQGKIESLLAADTVLKDFAKGAFVSYIKSVHLMSDKSVFNVKELDTDKYATSLGLAVPPRVRFLQKEEKRKKQQEETKASSDIDTILAKLSKSSEQSVDTTIETKKKDKHKNTVKKGSDEGSGSDESEDESQSEDDDDDSGSDSDSDEEAVLKFKGKIDSETRAAFDVGDNDLDDILTMKTKDAVVPDPEDEKVPEKESNKGKKKAELVLTKYSMAKLLQKKNIKINTKVTFDDEGEEVDPTHSKPTADSSSESEEEEKGLDIQQAKKRMAKEDKVDRKIDRARVKKMHTEKRLKAKDKRRQKQREKDGSDDDDEGEGEAVLASGDEEAGNLDWLPDPDKVYGKEDSDGSQDESDDDDDDGPPTKRSRGKKTEEDDDEESSSGSEEDMSDEEEEEDEDGQLGVASTVQDDEDLALKLLG